MQPDNEENAAEIQAGAETQADSAGNSGGGGAAGDEFTEEIFSEWLESAESAQADGESAAGTGGCLPDEPADAGRLAEMKAKTAELEAALAESRDQLLRKAADFDNFRKRMNQDKQNAIDFANQSLLLDIIPIIDDFERAIQSAETSEELKALPAGKAMLDGIAMIEKRLAGQLEAKWGLKRFSSAGQPFDPNIHEAMLMEKSAEIDEPVVLEDFVKGYTLKDRVIRAAKVKVLMPEEGE